nr:VapC toxin family PIN domain ribonuclease [Limnobacter parvus]
MVRLLNEGSVLGHPFVLGEMALANLQDRERVLIWMADLEPTVLASPTEVLELVELRELHGQGLGYVDTHLLASVLLSPGTTLWTRDMQLLRLVKELGLQPPIQDRFFMHDSVRQYTDDGKR